MAGIVCNDPGIGSVHPGIVCSFKGTQFTPSSGPSGFVLKCGRLVSGIVSPLEGIVPPPTVDAEETRTFRPWCSNKVRKESLKVYKEQKTKETPPRAVAAAAIAVQRRQQQHTPSRAAGAQQLFGGAASGLGCTGVSPGLSCDWFEC